MISNMGSFLLVDQVAVLPAKFDPVFSFCLAVIESGRRGGFPEDGRYQVRQASVLLVLHTMTQVKTVTAIVTAPTVQTMILENSRRGLLCLFKVFDPVVRDLDPLFDKGACSSSLKVRSITELCLSTFSSSLSRR